MDAYLEHYGMPRRSGRYPWGSGENPYQHNSEFLRTVHNLRKEGKTESEIAEIVGCKSTTELRAKISIESNNERKANIEQAVSLKQKGYSNTEIGRQMGVNESTVRGWLNPDAASRIDSAQRAADILKDQVDSKGYIDVGSGVELSLGISEDKKKVALAILKEEGYNVFNIDTEQLGTGHKTKVLVLAPPDISRSEVAKNKEKIASIEDYTVLPDGTHRLGVSEPVSISSNRIEINYAETGGKEKDGVIELRRGVDDISLGDANYAQVRIAVDGTHYLKGMAMYSDDLPEGVDIRFNTNKHEGTSKEDVFKPLKADKDNPFGSSIKEDEKLRLVQRYYIDKDGNQKQSAINVVNEEGDWQQWSKTLSSQFLSKQSRSLAKKQLDLAYKDKAEEFDDICNLTNPTIKRKLLESFADDCDASAVHLKAAALPRQANHVILPITDIKENEVYAPNYRNGETVVLVRHPHGGTFEIPELVVNNKQKTAKRLIQNAPDAIGINSKVAERLSGADFDGDTVLVIPTNNVKIKTSSPLKQLKDFDPKEAYPGYEGMPKMKSQTKQNEMGKVSNLITDMTLNGASSDEIARAVKHSMVVIDAEKHNLDYRRSERENGIAELKKKYQGSEKGGASTLISRSKSEIRIPERKESYKVDPNTGKIEYRETGRTYINKNGKEVAAVTKTTKMAITDDAFTLSSGTPMEAEYASYANKMKALANEARKESLKTPRLTYSPTARQIYSEEVATLNTKLNNALKNAPKERQAQLKAGYSVRVKINDDPTLKDDHDRLSKTRSQELARARVEVGAKKPLIEITDKEWEAIQAGAISDSKLISILNNTDTDKLKKRATPRAEYSLSNSKIALIKSMNSSGYTLSEIADRIGVSTSTISNVLTN